MDHACMAVIIAFVGPWEEGSRVRSYRYQQHVLRRCNGLCHSVNNAEAVPASLDFLPQSYKWALSPEQETARA